MAEMSLGTNGRNNPGDVKGQMSEVLDKGDRKAYLKAKHLGKLRNQLCTQGLRQSSFSS
jgi:hypothetical protein